MYTRKEPKICCKIVHDETALSEWQKKCCDTLAFNVGIENAAYLSQHPEIGALISAYIAKVSNKNVNKMKTVPEIKKETAQYFTRNIKVLDKKIRNVLDLPPRVSYTSTKKRDPPFKYDKAAIKFGQPPKLWHKEDFNSDSEQETFKTTSSSFLSESTSSITLPTPEPSPPRVQTFSETMFEVISGVVDKAFYSKFDDEAIKYDTAYLEVRNAVETAMNIPVAHIKEDIAQLLQDAWSLFVDDTIQKENIAGRYRWEKRMKKKLLNKTLRRGIDFKGYTYTEPSTSGSESLRDDDYDIPRPCKCHRAHRYNRYPKDRFGCYLPRKSMFQDSGFQDCNISHITVLSTLTEKRFL